MIVATLACGGLVSTVQLLSLRKMGALSKKHTSCILSVHILNILVSMGSNDSLHSSCLLKKLHVCFVHGILLFFFKDS